MQIRLFGQSVALPEVFKPAERGRGWPSLFGSKFSQDPSRDKTGVKVTADSLVTVHNNNGDVAGCVRELQKWSVKGGHRFVSPLDVDEDVEGTLAIELRRFFNSPYSTTPTFKKLRDQMIFDREVSGNAFAYIIRNVTGTKILGLQVLDPRTVSIVSDKHGTVYRYIQRTSTEAVEFEPIEILHWKRGHHPNNPLFGMSPIEPIIWEVKTDLSAMVSNYKFFENNAVPAAQYIMDETLSDKELEEAVAFIKKQHGGAENRHKPSALVGVKEIKQIQLSHKDIEFLEGRKMSRQKVCGAYGVPEFLLGITDSVNNNNGEELFRKFIEGTVQDLEADFESFINDQLFSRLGIDGLVEFKVRTQRVETQAKIVESALNEFKSGAITLRQYKLKTGQKITADDEANEMIDQYIIHQGAGAVSIEDVGTQNLEAVRNAEAIKALTTTV